jgi:hypothetical protein
VDTFLFPEQQANPYGFEQIHSKHLGEDYNPMIAIFLLPLQHEYLVSAFE